VCTHWSTHYYPGNYLRLHLYIFANVQLLLFFVWAITGASTTPPWFILPFIGWVIVLGIHIGLHTAKPISKYTPPEIGNLDTQDKTSSSLPSEGSPAVSQPPPVANV